MALDIIARCAFGIETDATANPDDEIIREGKAAVAGFVPSNWIDVLTLALPVRFFPFILKYVDIFPPAYDRLWAISDGIMRQRESMGTEGSRDDFIDRLMRLKREVTKDSSEELNADIVTAQASTFFIGGFKSVSSALTSICYELALHPDVQERAYEEICEKGFGAVDEMEYLDAVINETLRLDSNSILHWRICRGDCEVRNN